MAEKVDQNILNIIIAILVVLISIVFYCIYQWGKKTGRTILLTGICDSGKTLIFTRLIHGKFANTHTSIKENEGLYTTVKGKKIQIVDVPGHERLRNKYIEQYKNNARGFIYIIDSLTLQKDIRDVADYLYTLLTDPKLSMCKNVLIFCNKQDHATSKGIPVIKNLLEKELNTVRVTRSHSLKSIDGSNSDVNFLGIEDQDFEFEHILPTIVSFAEGYALDKDNNDKKPKIDDLVNWIGQIS